MAGGSRGIPDWQLGRTSSSLVSMQSVFPVFPSVAQNHIYGDATLHSICTDTYYVKNLEINSVRLTKLAKSCLQARI